MAEQPGDAECAPLTFKVAVMLWQRAHGWPYDRIGEGYGIKGATVRNHHLRKARAMLGVGSEDEAIAKARELGIFDRVLALGVFDAPVRYAEPQ